MRNKFLPRLLSLAICLQNPLLTFTQVNKTPTQIVPDTETYSKLAAEMEATLRRDVLGVWFPRSLDREHGGFLEGLLFEGAR